MTSPQSVPAAQALCFERWGSRTTSGHTLRGAGEHSTPQRPEMADASAAVMHALFDSDSDEPPAQVGQDEAAGVVRFPPERRARAWEQP